MSGKVHTLKGAQAQAVEPGASVWLSASAGTGKTQVLSARVLRLLLDPDVAPEQILCLTFTKAGAAEMATRVNEVLAQWVRMPDAELAGDLIAIGAGAGPETLARARALFARVLDCPGGGLRIDTIHAFAQWLLAAFPSEAGLVPGTRAMEDRDKELLAHRILAQLVVDWQGADDEKLLAALEMLSVRMGPDGARAWLMRCAQAYDAWFGPGGWQEPIDDRVRGLLGLPAGAGDELIAALCEDGAFDCASLKRCMEISASWSAPTGQKAAERIGAWLGLDPAGRAGQMFDLYDVFHTKAGELRSTRSFEKIDPDYREYAERAAGSIAAVVDQARLLEAIDDVIVPALLAGRRFAVAWDEAKRREGLIDFDDQIRSAAALLSRSDQADWIRYKLDRQFDHILVDEAQDTNAAQWSIIRALTGDFFAGEGQADGKLRTIFVVGDYKQAIFGFQGTSPENFEIARGQYAAEIESASFNARELADRSRGAVGSGATLHQLGLDRSYRTAQPVLDFVDRAIETIGHQRFGLAKHPGRHEGDRERTGLVRLWQPVSLGADAAEGPEDAEDTGDGEETWLPGSERTLAQKIADQVSAWLRDGYPLVKGTRRNAGPGDIMVLVRKRRELAGLIVARLHAAGIPVAGVDRLRLGAPLAVKDLMAALRFAAQPLDDLSLANLLASPLIGWTQEQLLEHGYRDAGVRLWDHLRASRLAEPQRVVAMLRDLLARADFEAPQALIHWVLLGPWQGKRALVARLGREAADPIDELLNVAQLYAAAHTPSLHGFIQWFDADDGELQRDPGGDGGVVRVMTVHGSKGLQAPIVILADATGNPDRQKPRGLDLEEQLPGSPPRKIPLPSLGKAERIGRIADADAAVSAAEREEHWRLLYVAMTRAEEALFIGGALLAKETEPAPDSWYARLRPLVSEGETHDEIWGWHADHGEAPPAQRAAAAEAESELADLPGWAMAPVGAEPRPPRPLAPSSAGVDAGADPPRPPGAAAIAARRGVLIHRLLERLPAVPPHQRREVAGDWLARQAPDLAEPERAEMLAAAIAVLETPVWAPIFSEAALAEVPLAATVGGQVVAGTADRLLVESDRVLVVDFKTARRPPATLEQVPASAIRQMAAYVAALEAIYPGRTIEAALLYTQTPLLLPLSAEALGAQKADLLAAEDRFAG